ncbi:hypothetical protein [Petrocella sp. FN5]|uniref:hypothetical protein n=1 Tax=Petrocella sp. FN5 TaxID=3032002 RepID=UPI0023DB1207|nr:hypothetical protein [Petrocella sp. FN5]MDF1617302.1 hypothetical protein [Petrocella sp. FN5]
MVCLIKFGELEYMKKLIDGEFYFSHAKRFRELEDELIKGQGDKFEGKAVVNTMSVRMYDPDTDEFLGELKTDLMTFSAAMVTNIPVYCLSVFWQDDCIFYKDSDNYALHFSDDIIKTIREHFPKADTAAIFHAPQDLLAVLEEQTKGTLVHNPVEYLSVKPIGMEWIRFVGADDIEKIDGGSKLSITTNNVHRTLFAKDTFFRDEKEYRVLIRDEQISTPEVRTYNIGNSGTLIDMEKLFRKGLKVVDASVVNFS